MEILLFFKVYKSKVDFNRYGNFDIIMTYFKPKYIKLEQLFLELKSKI